MQSEDTYRLKLQQLIASIKAWTGFVADVARVAVVEEASACRVTMQPKAIGACPIEIVLNSHEQKCDLRIAGETYPNCELPSLDLVLPLIEAVAEGRVMTRRTSSAATGLVLSVVTVIRLADGRMIEPVRAEATGNGIGAGAVESREIHYLPYRRPSA